MVTEDQLTFLSLTDAANLIRTGELSPLQLVQAHLDRINNLDGDLNSFITLTTDEAMMNAEEATKLWASKAVKDKAKLKPLFGIPIALKDLYETKGTLTTAGSTFYADNIPDSDGTVVEKLKSAGAILLGKLNMHEIALGVTNVNPHYGAVKNPWLQDRICGGSSGGSAAALAAGFCMGSMGSDTGGSIRIPASLCGVVGLKPTFGRVSLNGVIPLSWNLDHAGPMARQVLDVGILLQTVAGFDPKDPNSAKIAIDDYTGNINAGVKNWKIAIAQDDFFSRTDNEVNVAMGEAGAIFKDLGANVAPVNFPGAYEAAKANGLMVVTDAAVIHQARILNQPERFGRDVLERLRSGLETTTFDYINARRVQVEMRRWFEQFFEDFDLLVTPTTPIRAPLIEGQDAVRQAQLLTRFTAPFNITGFPAITLPCGFTSEGLPIGMQLVCQPWGEVRLLQAAYAYEQATDWHKKHPKLG